MKYLMYFSASELQQDSQSNQVHALGHLVLATYVLHPFRDANISLLQRRCPAQPKHLHLRVMLYGLPIQTNELFQSHALGNDVSSILHIGFHNS